MTASSFTAHNIRLDSGELTMPDNSFEFSQQPVLHAAQRVLRMLYPGGFRGKRIADLGCLEGGYAVEFARMGFDAVGIEVRPSNFANCMYVRERVNLPNLRFVNDDVWNIERYGPFDSVFCCGLLYHLDRPFEFLRRLSAVCSDAVIIHTHCASTTGRYGYLERGENEGARGAWYPEYQPGETPAMDDRKWASWANRRSFWPAREWMAEMLRQVGFGFIAEQFDWLAGNIAEEMTTGFYAQEGRMMFVGIKTGRQCPVGT